MGIDGDRCPRCGAEAAWARCLACYEADHPPITQRGSKWSPLAIAGLSLVCDPLMIPTIFAIVRAVGELREVGRREAFGLLRDEHASVRTGAVWAIAIAAARPLVLVVVILIMVVRAALFEPAHPPLPDDELGEILERLDSDDADVRELALDHLWAIGPELSDADAGRALDAVDDGFGHDEATELEVRSSAVAAVARAGMVTEELWPRFSRLYPTLDADARQVLLAQYVENGTPTSLRFFAALAGRDHDPDGLWLSSLGLDQQSGHAAIFVEPLVLLPAEASLRAGVPRLLSDLCDEGLSHRVLAPVRARLIADSQASLAALPAAAESLEERTSDDRIALVTRAKLNLGALRCVSGGDVDALLETASAHPDSLVAVAAVRALLLRDRPVSPAALARLGADPFSRADLLDALHRQGRELEVPAEHRTEPAIAEAHLLRAFHVEGASPLVAYRWIERVEPRPGAGVHLFEVTFRRFYDGDETHHIALGPYPTAQHRGNRLLLWSDGERPTEAALAEAMAARAELLEYTDVDAVLAGARRRDPEALP